MVFVILYLHRLEFDELLHVFDGIGHAPNLIRIDHEHSFITYRVTREFQSVSVFIDIAANLELELVHTNGQVLFD